MGHLHVTSACLNEDHSKSGPTNKLTQPDLVIPIIMAQV